MENYQLYVNAYATSYQNDKGRPYFPLVDKKKIQLYQVFFFLSLKTLRDILVLKDFLIEQKTLIKLEQSYFET